MFEFRNIDGFIPYKFEKVGELKGKRWYIDSKKRKKGLFKPKRPEFKDKKVFCANHYGEFVGSVLARLADIPTCKAELAHLSQYYENIHKEINHGTPEEKDGCIIYSQLEREDTLEAGKIIIERFKARYRESYERIIKDDKCKGDVNDNVELVFASSISQVADFYRMKGIYSEEFIQAKIQQTRKRIIEMIVYDCLYGNYDRHDENWSMHIKGNENIDLYPLYDNERVLGLYENQSFIEDTLRNQEVEKKTDENFFSRMHVPGETKKNSTYKEMLEYLMNTYPQETREILQKQLSRHTAESIRKLLEECEGLPSVYVDFATQMYTYRNAFAKGVLQNIKNFESLRGEEER